MDRRDFLKISGLQLAALGMGVSGIDILSGTPAAGKRRKDGGRYSVVILGDTHFDTEPADVYHSLYNEPVEWLNRVQREEFARNGEMWRERCPRLLRRAACLVDDDTRMILQTGDLIQGDCGAPEVHRKMLDDVMNSFKQTLGGLPFVTVVGNHDIRGNYNEAGSYDKSGAGARSIYHSYMPQRMGKELELDIQKTTFAFNIGPDAFIVIDFNNPDDAEVERLLALTEGARHTFILIHGPVLPFDGGSCRWFYHGSAKESETAARRHFRELFAKRHAIVLCGHTHKTELAEWHGDGGSITQMTMNSVWSKDGLGSYTIDAEGAESYGELRKKVSKLDNGTPPKDETPLFDEYRSGLKRYLHSPSAGCYKLCVDGKKVWIDFYAGDSPRRSERFYLAT